jgi:hypothetical protein
MSTYKKERKLTTKAHRTEGSQAHEEDLKPRNQVLCAPSWFIFFFFYQVI